MGVLNCYVYSTAHMTKPGFQNIPTQKYFFSLECMEQEAAEYGDQVAMNRTALGTIKLFYDKDDLRSVK